MIHGGSTPPPWCAGNSLRTVADSTGSTTATITPTTTHSYAPTSLIFPSSPVPGPEPSRRPQPVRLRRRFHDCLHPPYPVVPGNAELERNHQRRPQPLLALVFRQLEI